MKRIISLLVIIAFAAIFAMSGCKKNDKIDRTRTQLYVNNFNGGFGDAWLNDLVLRFEESQKDVSYQEGRKGVQVMINNAKDGGAALFSTMQASTDEVFFTEKVYYADFVSSGYMLEITDIMTKTLTDLDANDTRSIEGKLSGAEYQILKYAYNSAILMETNDTGNFSLSFNSKGIYQIEARIKQAGAKSYELYKFKDIVIGERVIQTNDIEITPILDNDGVVLARRPYLVTAKNFESDQQVKFVVSSYGKWQIKEEYSPNNQFVWTPEKEGTYVISAWVLNSGRTAYFDYITTSDVIEVLTRKPAELGEIESFSDAYSIAAVKTSNVSHLWLSEYADSQGTVAHGVIKSSFNQDIDSLYIKPRQEKSDYNGFDSLIIRMLIVDPNNAVEWFRFADGGIGHYQINSIFRGEWHNYILPASVFINNFDAFNEQNWIGGRIVFKSTAGKSYQIYVDTVYLLKRTPVEANEVENFSDALSESSIKNYGVSGVTWLEEFNGENGVIKVNYSKTGADWPALRFIPRQSKSAYQGYTTIRMRMYIHDPDDVIRWIRLTDTTDTTGGAELVKGEWHDFDFSASVFIQYFDDFLPQNLGKGFVQMYNNKAGNFSIYIDSIFMV